MNGMKDAILAMRALLRARRGVEGLPLKYAIILLVAAIAIGMAVYVATTMSGGVQSGVNQINQTLAEQLNKSLNIS